MLEKLIRYTTLPRTSQFGSYCKIIKSSELRYHSNEQKKPFKYFLSTEGGQLIDSVQIQFLNNMLISVVIYFVFLRFNIYSVRDQVLNRSFRRIVL